MKKDHKAYEEMYTLIRKRVKGKQVLELATGTGLIAKNVAKEAMKIDATDFAPDMIREAKKGAAPANVNFSVEDACKLTFADDFFDVVIISNALHIMPEPEKALMEISRVLKGDGLLIAPTFTHANMSAPKRVLSKFMGLFGFKTENKWTSEQYKTFLEKEGWK